MPVIQTLVADINKRLKDQSPYPVAVIEDFAKNLARKLVDKLCSVHKAALRLSNLGTPCSRKLWYSINTPELAEPLPASARFKFLFGDIIEELLLFLATAAGHKVERQQEEVHVQGVRGHIDATIDGDLVDAKSASTYSFRKFASGGLRQDDPFGYLTQLGSYLSALGGNVAHFLVADKTLGKICLDTYSKESIVPNDAFDELVNSRRKMLAWPLPPNREYSDIADGASGNRKLGLACSYCAFKSHCWPGLRVFDYSRGPVFLTAVAKLPLVKELTLEEVKED